MDGKRERRSWHRTFVMYCNSKDPGCHYKNYKKLLGSRAQWWQREKHQASQLEYRIFL